MSRFFDAVKFAALVTLAVYALIALWVGSSAIADALFRSIEVPR